MAVRKFNGNLNAIGDNLREYRIRKKLSQADIARQLNLLGVTSHKNDIHLIEANKRTVKDIEVWAFVKVLGISYNDLYEGIEKKLGNDN